MLREINSNTKSNIYANQVICLYYDCKEVMEQAINHTLKKQYIHTYIHTYIAAVAEEDSWPINKDKLIKNTTKHLPNSRNS